MDDKMLKILPLIGIVLVVILMFTVPTPVEKKDPMKDILSGNTNNQNQNSSSVNNLNNMENINMDKLQTPKFTELVDTKKSYTASFETNMGNFKIKLFAEETPITVSNFVYLSRLGFYDGLTFHRVIKDFMIQGGDPTGTGAGGPAYKFEDEITSRPLVKGSLAMANAGKNTNGSQFFIVTAEETPWLNGNHTNFGEVTEGMDVVMKISEVKTQNDRPVEPVIISKITILEQ